MLLLLTLFVVICTFAFLAIKRDEGSLIRVCFSLSFGVFIFGILTYIAKKGGYSNSFNLILYGLSSLKHWMQYLQLTLGHWGTSSLWAVTFSPASS